MLLREISLISLQPLSSTCSSVPLEFPVAFSDVHGCVLNLSSQFEGWTPCHVFVPPTEPRKYWQDHRRCWLNDGNIPLGKSRLPAWALSRAAYTVPIPQGVGASTPLPGVATSVQLRAAFSSSDAQKHQSWGGGRGCGDHLIQPPCFSSEGTEPKEGSDSLQARELGGSPGLPMPRQDFFHSSSAHRVVFRSPCPSDIRLLVSPLPR